MLYSSDRSLGYLDRSKAKPQEASKNSVVVPHPTLTRWHVQPATPPGTKPFSNDFWTEAKKRHCDARDHWRSLLNKHLQPSAH